MACDRVFHARILDRHQVGGDMTTSDVGRPGAKPASGQSAAANWVLTVVVNIVLPTATYFLLAGPAGMQEIPALLVSGLWPVLDIGYTLAKQRHVDEFGVFVLIGILIGVLTTVFSGTARAVFLKDSITTGAIGVVMLVTLLFGRPLTFYLGRRFATDGSKIQRDWWDRLWQYPNFRAVQRRLGAVWGVSLLGEAVIRAVLTWKLGTSAMVVVNNVVPYLVIAVLVFYSVSTGRRAEAAAQRRHGDQATPPTAPA